MDGLVVELQRKAMAETSITTLLRHALVVATKLKRPDFQEWIRDELEGYADQRQIPEYRLVLGQLQGFDPYRGWLPVRIEDSELERIIATGRISQPIAEIEALSEVKKTPAIQLTGQQRSMIARATGEDTDYCIAVQTTSLRFLIDAVRNAVLRWALQLEEDGIIGADMSFTPTEQQLASHRYNINNFLGPVTNSNIQQAQSARAQWANSGSIDTIRLAQALDELQRRLEEIEIEQKLRDTIESEVITIRSQLNSPIPKWELVSATLDSLTRTLEGMSATIGADILMRFADGFGG